jgi:cytochrome c-type biogenesis protein CcmF
MIIELGHFAALLAFTVALVQTVVPLWGAYTRDGRLMAVAGPAALAQAALIAISFAALTYGFVVSDFSLKLVVDNSHTDKPLLYKITGVWGNHEGSLLLWALSLAVFGAAAAIWGGNLTPTLRARVLAVQGSIGAAFLAFMLFTSNPFLRLESPPLNGADLNPLLQDPGLAFHPPFLYLGYVGLSMSFSFAVAALMEGRVDAAWGRWVRPWTLAAWVFLTIGIAMGSWWAYYELGWGGFWFWDPVENASFMPWLIGTALLHSAIVVEKRESLKAWTILLAILAFGFSLMGTFIVRSGVITSVHSFASDPARGMFILLILGFFMGGALTLFAARAHVLASKGVFSIISRESALVANNLLLSVSAFVVFVGTMWPLFVELAFGQKISVGAPFFDAAFTPFMVALALILPIGAIMPWKRGEVGRTVLPLRGAIVLALAALALTYAVQTGTSAVGPIGALLGLWVVLGALVDMAQRTGRAGIGARFGRALRLPRADLGRAVAHIGFGVTVFAVAGITTWVREEIRAVNIGEAFPLGRYEVTLVDVTEVQGPNYIATRAQMRVTDGGEDVATLFPERRIYPVARMPTTEAAIHRSVMNDIYLVIGDPQEAGGFAVRGYVKPFANWIWAGCILMSLGGLLSLTDRRFRVAAGSRAPKPKLQPAE